MANSAVTLTKAAGVNAKISTIMGASTLDNANIKTISKDYLYTAMTTVAAAIDSVLGNTRMAPYVGSNLIASQKVSLGINKIHTTLQPAYLRAGSAVIHNGSVDNLWFHNGNVYKISLKVDFEAANALIHTRMAYLYTNANGTSAETSTALGNYTTELGNLS